MYRNRQLVMSLGTTVAGWLLCGFALKSTQSGTVNNICIVLGLMFSVFGFIAMVIVWKKSVNKDE